jgi:porin
MALPENGLGAVVSFSPGNDWYLNVGIGDANGRKTDLDFNSFFDDKDYFTAAEFGWTPDIQGVGQGYYQLTAWDTDGRRTHTQSKQSSGSGFALRFEQFLGEEFMSFVTYSKSSGGATSVRQLATAGIAMLDIGGYQDDIIGVAVGWGQPEDRNLRNQAIAEVFYRMQITDYLQVTPDLQIIKNPSQNRSDDTIGVIGLRLRLDF